MGSERLFCDVICGYDVMTALFGTPDYVTLISLVGSGFAVLLAAIALFVVWRSWKKWTGLATDDHGVADQDTIVVVQEFSQRLKKLEERLVQQKVSLEILELRQSRGSPNRDGPFEVSPDSSPPLSSGRIITPRKELLLEEKVGEKMAESESASEELLSIETEVLKIVFGAGKAGITAKQVQGRIGRSREHTARMMNSLSKRGLVMRNEHNRPFSYVISDKGLGSLR